MYRTKEFFKILPIEYKSDYLKFFLDFHKKEIAKFTGLINPTIDNSKVMFFVLRNMIPAGVFICSKHDDNTLKIELDFAVKQYRDFRIGSYIFESKKEYFMKMGYDSFICYSDNPAHINYLKKMGFELQGSNDTCYIKRLTLEK